MLSLIEQLQEHDYHGAKLVALLENIAIEGWSVGFLPPSSCTDCVTRLQSLKPSRNSPVYLRFLSISNNSVCCHLSTLITTLYFSTSTIFNRLYLTLQKTTFVIGFPTCCNVAQWHQNGTADVPLTTSTLKHTQSKNFKSLSHIPN